MSQDAKAIEQAALNLVDGSIVDRVRRLELFSRFRVEGALSGNNKSPYKGFSADFMQHRQYYRGDNLKYLDWRVFGKSGKLYIREYEELTNARISIIVDSSNSMSYRGAGNFSKMDFAVRSAAVMSYMAFLHKDSFSLACFDERSAVRTPFGSGKKHLRRVLRTLVEVSASGGTDFVTGIQEASSNVKYKGLTIVLSDFMDEPERIVKVISRLRLQGSDVIAMQLFDPTEREFDFTSITRFHDLEGSDILVVDPQIVKRAYQREFDNHQVEMKDACQRHGFEHTALSVQDDYDVPLLAYVRARMELFS